MQARELLRFVFRTMPYGQRETSLRIGRSRDFISNYVATKRVPNLELAAEIFDAIDCDLLLRDRFTGDEIIIDPPEK